MFIGKVHCCYLMLIQHIHSIYCVSLVVEWVVIYKSIGTILGLYFSWNPAWSLDDIYKMQKYRSHMKLALQIPIVKKFSTLQNGSSQFSINSCHRNHAGRHAVRLLLVTVNNRYNNSSSLSSTNHSDGKITCWSMKSIADMKHQRTNHVTYKVYSLLKKKPW